MRHGYCNLAQTFACERTVVNQHQEFGIIYLLIEKILNLQNFTQNMLILFASFWLSVQCSKTCAVTLQCVIRLITSVAVKKCKA